MVTTFEELYGLDSMANLLISSDLLNKIEYVKNLKKSFNKKIPIKSRLVSFQNDTVQYLKSINVIYHNLNQVNSSFFKTDRDCFNVL